MPALWWVGRRPLPDDEASHLFTVFYQQLALGHTVGEALTEARRQRLVAGDSAQGWGSIVILGDADLRPFPGGLQRTAKHSPLFWSLALLLIPFPFTFFRLKFTRK